MNVSDWIKNREIRGMVTFSMNDVYASFADVSPQYLYTELLRMVKRKRIQSVYRGFYVIVPPQYALKGIIPPTYYIDRLMQFIGKPYYVALLSAASFHGAAHQRPMKTQVVTVPPRASIAGRNGLIDWNYRQKIPTSLLMKTNTEMGTVLYSCPELTAVDIVQFAGNIGGYQRAATVLAELSELLEEKRMSQVVDFATTAALQRLGCILEHILNETEKADTLYNILRDRKLTLKSIKMSNDHPKSENAMSNRWHVNMNIDIEIDDI